jgi:dolichol-phosphate mannosyltransferase
MKKLVVIPVYNEAKTLKGVLDRISEHHSGDIVAVDDGSTDGSAEILDNYPGLIVINHEQNSGYGRSLIDGFRYAVDRRYDLVVTIDCDEQHEPRLIPMMFNSIDKFDILSGSRYLRESERADRAPEDRRRINMLITKAINQITGFNLTDSFCGFKCYQTSALAKLSLDEAGYAQPIQFWIQANHFGLTVREIAVPRIYKNLDRKFGGGIDNPELRLAYYMGVMEKEMEKWSIFSSSELTPTI